MKRYDVSTVVEYEEGKSRWSRIGVAFPMKSKDGFNIILDATPVNGKLVMLVHEDKADAEGSSKKSGGI